MTAAIHNTPFLNHHDPVGEPDRGKPVRDEEHRASFSKTGHGVADQMLGFGIQLARGFV